jgi:hypothetical protein
VDPKELGLFDHGTEAGLTPEQAADIPKVTKAFARILHVIKVRRPFLSPLSVFPLK